MKKTIKKSLAVLAAASVCSSMLLNFPSGTFSIHWNWQASAEESEGSTEGVAIDAANFPDETFRTYIQENFDTTADGILSESERKQVTKINVSSKGISDLTGVEYFTVLKELHCSYNNLTELDLSQNTALQGLFCYSNQLKELDVRQNIALEGLYCYNNNLTALDLSQNTALTNLECDSNTYSIALTGGTFDLSTLPEGFDLSKASNWKNATVDGNTLTVTNPKADVTYTYDLGNEKTETFTLRPTSCTLTESMVKEIPEQVYTGSAVTPDVVLQYGEDTLKKDVDYTVSYTNNQHTGTGNAIITGKGIFSGTVTVPFGIGVAINETTFPDENFRTYVKENFDTTADDILTVSELERVTMIDVSVKEISDLTGVEYFTALQRLFCSNNNLTKLDLSQNTALQRLIC